MHGQHNIIRNNYIPILTNVQKYCINYQISANSNDIVYFRKNFLDQQWVVNFRSVQEFSTHEQYPWHNSQNPSALSQQGLENRVSTPSVSL